MVWEMERTDHHPHPATSLQDHLRRTLGRALAAVGTLAVVDHRHIVIHVDRVGLALLGA